MKQVVTHSFDAYFNPDSEILILGSMPSVKSRELGFYYMHSRNRFWTVLSKIYEEEIPENISLKKEFLKKHKIALWDVLQSCEIENSSDSSISNVITNDIKGLLEKTNIQKIYTTGKKAFFFYQKYIYPKAMIEAVSLPSTSPANACLSTKDLILKYQVIRGDIKNENNSKRRKKFN